MSHHVTSTETRDHGVTSATSPDPATEPADAVTAGAIRVESGHPSPEEIAAIVAVLSAVGGPATGGRPRPTRSAWSDPSWRLVGPSAARGDWRTSGLPR